MVINIFGREVVIKGGAIIIHSCSEKFRMNAVTYGFFVIGDVKDDPCMLVHELVHVHQFWRTWGLFMVLKLLSKKYRYESEIEAYAQQYKCHQGGININDVSLRLTPFTSDSICQITNKILQELKREKICCR